METFTGINKKKILVRITSLILFICVLNFMAMRFYWYTSMWWFDMPMHFLGGLWVGLVFLWLLKPKEFNFLTILKIIFGVLIIGLSWEIFEILVNHLAAQDPFNTLDTLSDLSFDLMGASFSILYFTKRIMLRGN